MSEVALCRHSAQLFGCKPIKIQFSPSMSHSIPFLTDYVDRNIFLVKLLLESNYSKLSHGSVPKLLVGANNFHLQHMEKKKTSDPITLSSNFSLKCLPAVHRSLMIFFFFFNEWPRINISLIFFPLLSISSSFWSKASHWDFKPSVIPSTPTESLDCTW